LQEITLVVDVGSSCSFSGTYNVNSTVSCRSGVSQCPLTSLTDVSSVSLDIEGDSTCASVSVYSSLTGSLSTFSDSGFSSPKTSFLVGDVIYGEISLNADVDLSTVQINNLNLKVNSSDSLPLVSSTTTTATGTLANYVLLSAVANSQQATVQFQFQVTAGTSSSNLFQTTQNSVSFSFDIEVTVDVTYMTNFGRKRSIQDQSLNLQQKVFFESPLDGESTTKSDASSLKFSSSLMILLSLICLLFLA